MPQGATGGDSVKRVIEVIVLVDVEADTAEDLALVLDHLAGPRGVPHVSVLGSKYSYTSRPRAESVTVLLRSRKAGGK
jgi:hypothetical protein